MIQQMIQIVNLTPEQLGEMLDQRFAKALANYTPPMPTGSDLPEYPTRRQTRDFLHASYTTLNNWAKDSDKGPAILVPLKMAGRIRYRRADVLAVFSEKRRFKTAKADGGHAQ